MTSRPCASTAQADTRLPPPSFLTAGEQEVVRVLQICNACRYCEGFCAVFPAMARRARFDEADAHYLANLCHNCGACLHACQYAPPHEFAVDVPAAMAVVRVQTYRDFSWPPALGGLYDRAGLTVALALAGGLASSLALAAVIGGGLVHASPAADFYAAIPHGLLAAVFGIVFLFDLFALGIGVVRFWREASASRRSNLRDAAAFAPIPAAAVAEAASDVATLRYLGGGHGEGCNEESERFTLARRRFHHLAFYGFLLCFAATSVANLYHYLLGWEAPYAAASLPVVLGSLGGAGLLIGPAGLLWLNFRRYPQHGDARQGGMDRGFIALLMLTSATGFLLFALRDTRLMPLWLAIHLGVVMALFLTLPYGKFAHGVFRAAALLEHAIEKRLAARGSA